MVSAGLVTPPLRKKHSLRLAILRYRSASASLNTKTRIRRSSRIVMLDELWAERGMKL